MSDAELLEGLRQTLRQFCEAHQCEVVLVAMVPSAIARAAGLEQASVPVEVRVVRRPALPTDDLGQP